MYPIIRAYGLTAHKSQGSTSSYVIAGFQKQLNNKGMPAPQGLDYTMLSKATCRARIPVINFNKANLVGGKAAHEEIKRITFSSTL